MKYYIIAGEASGDLHASNLIKELKARDGQAEIRAWGGDLMRQAGAEIVKHYRELAFMGFAEVLANLRTILGNMKFCKRDIAAFAPDAVIFVDYPGFNLNIASWCRKNGYRTYYYISPQVWAWKEGRVKGIKKNIDQMLVILPFEKDFYEKHRYSVDYVGHPLLDALASRPHADPDAFRSENGLDERPIIALLPGSRRQEIKKMLPAMASAEKKFPGYQFVVAGAPGQGEDFYDKLLKNTGIRIVYGKTYGLLSSAHAALVTSGTATLETALIGTPEVVCYKGSPLSYMIGRMVVKVPFISLVNLIAGRKVVTELIQGGLNAENIERELGAILSGPVREKMLEDYASIRHILGDGGASARAAALITGYMKKNGSGGH